MVLLFSAPLVRPLLLAFNRASVSSAVAALDRNEHLIWQPGFGPRFLLSLVACAAVSTLAPPSGTQALRLALRRAAGRFEWWFLVGLASSSCCALQLLLNATLAIGCAGFNTVLGPPRPAFLALAVVLQCHLWRAALAATPPRLAQAAAATALCTALSLLPEALHWWVHRRDGWRTGGGEAVSLQVGGMGCTACTQKVLSALEAVDGVDNCEVDLPAGVAWLRLGPRADAATLGRAARAVRDVGFTCDA